MKNCLAFLFIVLLFSCKENKETFAPSFSSVVADTLFEDDISIRALTIDGDKAWYAGSNGKYGFVSLNGGKNFSGIITKDTLFPEFRAIAKTNDNIFILNAGTPALLYKISKDGKVVRLMYTEEGEKVFYDSMQFFNDSEGLAMGDPTEDCLSVLKTTDGGETWTKVPCSTLPKTAKGEAAFAASNTNLVVKGNNAWMVSGGMKSRLFHSDDKGAKWQVHDTPIAQGTPMSGIFSVDFYDEKTGFAVGGNYEKPEMNSANKILTTDGGKTWERVGDGTGFGYASCVQFVPGSNGNELVTAGPAGIYYSYDRGAGWKKIYDDTKIHTLRFTGPTTIIAAGQDKIIRLKLK